MRPRLHTLTALLLLLLAACSGRQVEERPITSHAARAQVEVTFNVLIPAGTPDEDIQLSVLDEVTGIAFNPHRYTMEQVGDDTYSATISAPIGTLIKYRYVRQGASTVPEIAANGELISDRQFLVTGSGLIANDLVVGWFDTGVSGDTGQISGQITDAESGAPIGGLTVSASGLSTQTDVQGNFILGGLYQGQHTIVVSSSDGLYQSFQQAALVAAGMDTPANIELQRNAMISVTLTLSPPEDSVPGVPLYVVGNLVQLGSQASSPDELPRMQGQEDGSYALTLLLPTGVDIRYKYSLGDGFWNAEHLDGGGFGVRQLIIPTTQTSYEVQDQVNQWTAGDTAPIWFEVDVPPADPATAQVYLQFKLLDWLPALPMWPLGENHWAYKLYSPTNFASALEYRYCADSACVSPESNGARSVTGGQSGIQLLEDQVSGWQTP